MDPATDPGFHTYPDRYVIRVRMPQPRRLLTRFSTGGEFGVRLRHSEASCRPLVQEPARVIVRLDSCAY